MNNVTTIFQAKTKDANPIEALTRDFNKTTAKYQHVNTQDVIDRFLNAGLTLAGSSFGKARKEHTAGYQKHLVLFNTDYKVGDSILQLLLVSSHDGTSSFQISIGVFRAVCANGLVAGDTFGTERVKHVGDVLPKIDAAIKRQLERLPEVATQINTMSMITVTPDAELDLIKQAVALRLGTDIEDFDMSSFSPARDADKNNNLWIVFNRIQERIIRGGISYKKDGQWRRTRQIKAVTKTVKYNKELWNQAAELLGA